MKSMKHFITFLALMLFAGINAYGQSSVIATLNHEGQITAFYGADALKQAHNAAVDGDAITLSSGTFHAVDITKAITLRGAGMMTDAETQTYPTRISGAFKIGVRDTEHRLTMEGIYFINAISLSGTLSRAVFQKCNIDCINTTNISSANLHSTFINCYIRGYIGVAYSTYTLINCYVRMPAYSNSNTIELQNCVVNFEKDHSYLKNATITNCILYTSYTDQTYTSDASNSIRGCLFLGNNMKSMYDQFAVGNMYYEGSYDAIFKSFTGILNDDTLFKLTDEAANSYKGTDGTQVGMYGGQLPFDPAVSSIKITKCNVANKSTIDGKLSVDIEVSGVE